MAVIRTSHIDLHDNGNGAYAYVAQPDDRPSSIRGLYA